jgi:hypothetical protein
LLFAEVLTFSVTPAGAFPGETTRVSVDSAGNEVNSQSTEPSISANGRFVAFDSFAFNLVPGDINGVEDEFVHELAPKTFSHDRNDDDDNGVDDNDDDDNGVDDDEGL